MLHNKGSYVELSEGTEALVFGGYIPRPLSDTTAVSVEEKGNRAKDEGEQGEQSQRPLCRQSVIHWRCEEKRSEEHCERGESAKPERVAAHG